MVRRRPHDMKKANIYWKCFFSVIYCSNSRAYSRRRLETLRLAMMKTLQFFAVDAMRSEEKEVKVKDDESLHFDFQGD